MFNYNNDEEFIAAVKNSKTRKEVITKLGGNNPSSKLNKKVMDGIIRLGLDYSHFTIGKPTLYTERKFRKVIKNSTSIGNAIFNLNGSVSGSSYKTIKKYIDLWEVDISHFDKTARFKKAGNTKRRSITSILVKNSTYKSNTHLKFRLYEEGLKVEICELCNQGNIHNNKPLILQLDHINGINNDNELKNLRIICPNCHTQTKTWGMKTRIKSV